MQKTLKFRNFKAVNYHINTMLRNSRVHCKSSNLFSIMREHFGKDMNLARIKAMSMMICALCKVQRIAYTKLAAAFDNEAEACSSLRRIQRLIAECVINTDLIARLILKLIPVKVLIPWPWTGPTGSPVTRISISSLSVSSTTEWPFLSSLR